jgi:imidazolonepropionase-like amidohydrolase
MKKLSRSRMSIKILLLLAFCCPPVLKAQQFQQPPQEEKELAPVSKTYAITNATIVQAPGRKIEKAAVVIKDGLISAVGNAISIPAEAIIIKGDSLYIYAGFIDGLSHTGVTKPKEEQSRERPKDPGNPSPEAAGISPQNDVRSFINVGDKSIEDLRALGFTAAHVVPYGNMLPGTGAIVLLSGKSADAMVLAGKTSLYSELAGAQRVYPSTIIGVMAKWRELYRQAVQSKNYENLYASNRTGLNRPTSDRILESFYPVIDKKIPVLFEADKFLEIQRIIGLQTDLGFSLMLGDVKEGWDAIPKIKSSGAKVFLSLDLPEDKKEVKKDDKKDAKDKKETKPDEVKKKDEASTLSPAEKEALEKRQAEFLALYVGQAAAFQKAGVMFGFSSFSAKTADIRANLRRMIKAGLTEDQALGALTTNPAQLLGLSDRLGTVDNGKIANLVVSDKPYFNEKAKVRYVFVDGTMYKYDVKETPKGDPNAKVEIAGTWSVTTETPQGKSETTLTIKKDGSNYSGSVSGGRLPQAVDLEKVELSGNILKYSYTFPMGGQSLKVDVEATVEGTGFKGTATAGSFGNFPVEGKKDPIR